MHDDTITTPTRVGPDSAGLYPAAAHVTKAVARTLGLSPAAIERAMAISAWTTVAEMIEREFLGAYRGYYPLCAMGIRAEAVIAEVFDAIAVLQDDPRRALRDRHVGQVASSIDAASEGRADG